MSDVLIRPMRPEDVPTAERVSAEGFHDLDLRLRRYGDPEPEPRPQSRAESWVVRTQHLLETDPDGCWVAEDDTGMLGFATSLERETMWCLATFVVRPGLQGRGLGKQLLAAAMYHGRGCVRGMLVASADPKAVRRYRLAGFSLYPHMTLSGRVDRAELPVIEKVREGGEGDIDQLDSVDRQTRGAAHGPDHELLMRVCRCLVSDSTTGSGYAYLRPGGPVLLAATNRRTATRLLWAVLAESDPDATVEIENVTPENEWAVDVGIAARLEPRTGGYLGLRGMKPPAPYLPHGMLL